VTDSLGFRTKFDDKFDGFGSLLLCH